jgi:hypothetical protein
MSSRSSLRRLRLIENLRTANLGVGRGAGEDIAGRGGRILPADVAIVLGDDPEEHGRDGKMTAALAVATSPELAGIRGVAVDELFDAP